MAAVQHCLYHTWSKHPHIRSMRHLGQSLAEVCPDIQAEPKFIKIAASMLW
ncbi:hypothetical protein DPMN_035563 [Dreissena polymorpha]|uniref:Uncharacterized protein n=1 Tax=Dreissena polymorpha TaxID=45954 RepID=A0A9D4M915_DREPO|nr:hypothetical protein DPMN_035563 [Dreissena polymorpha]